MTSAPAGIAHRARRDSFGAWIMYPTVPYRRCEHPERPATASGPLSHTRTVRVLVVEDERRLASAVRRGLTAEGFVVDVAHDGVDGLHLGREGGDDGVGV